jgi:hypothetical protein
MTGWQSGADYKLEALIFMGINDGLVPTNQPLISWQKRGVDNLAARKMPLEMRINGQLRTNLSADWAAVWS